jgi:hypothetical protein
MCHITKPGGHLWTFRPQVFFTLFLHYLVNLGSSSFSVKTEVIWPRGIESGVFVVEAFLPYVSIGHINLLLTE